MRDDIERIFFSEEQILARVKELGAQITKDYEGKNPMFIGVLKGSFVFMADLIKNIDTYCDMDFMAVSSIDKLLVVIGRYFSIYQKYR